MMVVLDLLAVTVCHRSATANRRGQRGATRLLGGGTLLLLLRFLLHPCRGRLVTTVFQLNGRFRRGSSCTATTGATHTAVI